MDATMAQAPSVLPPTMDIIRTFIIERLAGPSPSAVSIVGR